MTPPTGSSFRPATPDDAGALARFRAGMLTDMGAPLEDGAEACWTAYFAQSVQDGRYRAELAETDGQPVACAGLMLFPTVPTPRDPSGTRAHIQGVYTLPAHRGRGLAAELTRRLLREAQVQAIGSANVNASVMGAGLCERLGFTPARAPEYRLNLAEAHL